MVLTAICLTFVVFFLTNLPPNLEKLAKTQADMRMSDAQVTLWLENRGYDRNIIVKYGEWLGVLPGYVIEGNDGRIRAKCARPGVGPEDAPRFCGVIQGAATAATKIVAVITPAVTVTGDETNSRQRSWSRMRARRRRIMSQCPAPERSMRSRGSTT